jgi:hypothetical protein
MKPEVLHQIALKCNGKKNVCYMYDEIE